MLRTFLSKETDAIIRRSALEQLSLCARDMEDSAIKQSVVVGLTSQLACWAAQSEAWGNTSECIELNMDCVKLLEQLVARNVDVCESGVEPWLPLIVHPSEGVRQAVATLLARVLFTGLEESVNNTAASKKAVKEMMLLVPAPFAACYRFPSDCRAVVVVDAALEDDDVGNTLSVKSLLDAREQLHDGMPAVLQRLEEAGCMALYGALRQIYAPMAVADGLDCIRAAKSGSDRVAAARLLHTRLAQFPEWVPVLLMESSDWRQALQCCLSMQPGSGDNDDTQVLLPEAFALLSIVIDAGNPQHAHLAAVLNVVLPALPDAVGKGGVLTQQALVLVRCIMGKIEEGSLEVDLLSMSLQEPSLVNVLTTHLSSSSPSPHLHSILQVLIALVRSAAMRKPRAQAEGLIVALGALVTPVIGIVIASMRVKDEAAWVCRGRGVLREAPWAAAGATTFWLARLARDPESTIRAASLGIVAELADPRAKETRRMLAQAWPEVAEIMVQTILAPAIECSAVRTSSLRFLISACSFNNTSQLTDDFSTAQLMRRYAFWPRLAKQVAGLRGGGGDKGFMRAVSAMLLHTVVRDVQAGKELLADAKAFKNIVEVMGSTTDAFLTCADGCATLGNLADLTAVLHHFGKLQEWHPSLPFPTLSALCLAFCACSNQSLPHLNPTSRLLRAYALEKLAGAAANLLSNDRLVAQVADGREDGGKLPTALLRDIARVMSAEASTPHAVKMACARLVGALMQDVDVAKAVLHSGEATSNNGDSPDSKRSDAGAKVCEGLLALHVELHSRSALASAKTRHLQQGSDGEESALARLATDRTVCGCALRNLLAYSSGAKRYAVEAKLIPSQLKAAETCRALLVSESLRLTVKERKTDHHKPKGGSKLLQDKSEEANNNRKLGEKEHNMLREELLMCLTLVKHAAYGGGQSDEDQHMGSAVDAAKQAALDAGVTALMLSLWPTCMIDEALMHERAFVSDADVGHNPRRHLLAGIVKLAARPDLDVKGMRMVYGILQVLATGVESLAVLLRTNVMRDSLRLLQGYYQKKCTAQQEVILRFFINVAGSPEGQRFITKSLTLAGCFDQILDVVENGGPGHAPVLALLLLRNLCFAHENKTHFVCNDRALPLLLDSLRQDAEARAYASSALWALTYKGEKVKASLKSMHAQSAVASARELNEKEAADAKQLPEIWRNFLEQAENNLKVVSDLLEAP
eukprot:jgi/Chlat1/970/Chrsp108S01393